MVIQLKFEEIYTNIWPVDMDKKVFLNYKHIDSSE